MINVAIDVETSGLNYYEDSFRVISCAFTWRSCKDNSLQRKYVEGHKEVGLAIAKLLAKDDVRLIVHNMTYELGVITCCYPEIGLTADRMIDTMRLTQVTDNGVPSGLSLVACVSRHLPASMHNHKDKFYDWIMSEKGVSKKEAGAYLGELPADMLKEYNTLDTDLTLLLYETLLDGLHAGWETDHTLYRIRVKLVVQAKVEGIRVDRDKLAKCIEISKQEIKAIEQEFFEYHKDNLPKVRQIYIDGYINDPKIKTERGRASRAKKVESGETDFKFNIYSTKDLATLFVSVLGIEPPFLTKPNKQGKGGGSPSFAAAHLRAWHESGSILEKKGKVAFRLTQAESLWELSEKDSRWHVDLRATGTKTGRLSGGSD